MFVANITPLIIIAGAATYNGQPFSAVETAHLLQNCMIIAGIGTLIAATSICLGVGVTQVEGFFDNE